MYSCSVPYSHNTVKGVSIFLIILVQECHANKSCGRINLQFVDSGIQTMCSGLILHLTFKQVKSCEVIELTAVKLTIMTVGKAASRLGKRKI